MITNKTSKGKNHGLNHRLKKCRNQLTHAKNKAKRSYFKNLFCKAKNPSVTWKRINRLLRK